MLKLVKSNKFVTRNNNGAEMINFSFKPGMQQWSWSFVGLTSLAFELATMLLVDETSSERAEEDGSRQETNGGHDAGHHWLGQALVWDLCGREGVWERRHTPEHEIRMEECSKRVFTKQVNVIADSDLVSVHYKADYSIVLT